MSFSDKQKLREFIASRLPWKKNVKKNVLQVEEKWYSLETQIYKKKGRASKQELMRVKLILFFLFFIDLSDNCLFKIIIALNLGTEHRDKWCKRQQYDKGMEEKNGE